MEILESFFISLMEDSGYFLLMFFVSGFVFNLLGEVVKKQIFPQDIEGEAKKCPKFVGMIVGLVLTFAFIAFASAADTNGEIHSAVIGGNWMLPVWFIAFYMYQMCATKVVKAALKKLFPVFMTGHKPEKAKKPVYQVPRGAKVEYVDKVE